jgi:hypothetical protein
MIIFHRKKNDALGKKEEDRIRNISSPIHIHLIVTQINLFFFKYIDLKTLSFNRIYQESKDQNEI